VTPRSNPPRSGIGEHVRVAERTLTLLLAMPDVDEPLDPAPLRAAAAAQGGTPEPTEAEGHLFSFPSALAAVRCAVVAQRAGARWRIGLHSGDVARLEGELRGRVVVKAARIAALAAGGRVLASAVTRDVADLSGSGGIWFDDPQEHELRGLPGRHAVAEVLWEDAERPPERVVIADDAALVRDGVAALLRESGLTVVATVPDAEQLLEAVDRHRPDVALIDIRMPPSFTNEGLVAAERIRAAHPEVGVLVLSQHVEPAYAVRLVEPGMARSGYLLKDRISDAQVLLDAVRRIARGGCVVDPELTGALVQRADADGRLAELSEREREVLALIAEGLSNRAIAARLFVTARTVETHVGQIFLKLGLRDETAEHRRVAAVITYLRSTGAV
jgi:DNA-binding NarL/FixJ family response regulator